jgi:hypothetical protein
VYFEIINSSTKNDLFSASNNRILGSDYQVFKVAFLKKKKILDVDQDLEAYDITFHINEPYTAVFTKHRINSNLSLKPKTPGLLSIQL